MDERDSKLHANAGFGSQYGIGNKSALIVVDVTCCGEDSWKSIPYIRRLLDASRQAAIPVFYPIIEGIPHISNERVAIKGNLFDHPPTMQGQKGSYGLFEVKDGKWEPIDFYPADILK